MIAPRAISDRANNSAQAKQLHTLRQLANSSPQVTQLRAIQLMAHEHATHRLQAARAPVVQRVDYSDAALNKKRMNAKVGLELAFNDAFTNTHFGNKGPQISHDYHELGQVISEAKKKMNDWAQVATAEALNHAYDLEIVDEPHHHDEPGDGAKHIFSKLGRKRFIYTGLGAVAAQEQSDELGFDHLGEYHKSQWSKSEALAPFTNDEGTWWFAITGDPAVFELQSDPTTWQVLQFTEVKEIIDNVIFAGANQLGLSADKGKGGGQINIDFETGFGGDYNKVLNAIVNNEKEETRLRQGQSELDEDDKYNAPYIVGSSRLEGGSKKKPVSDDRIREEWEAIYKKYRGKIDDEEGWTAFTDEFIAFLIKYPAERQVTGDFLNRVDPLFEGGDHRDDIHHYQALNVGHISDEKSSARRVEYRDFRAQANHDQILEAIDLALKVIPD